MAQLPQKLPLDMMQSKWASQLNPLLANPIMSGLALSNISIVTGSNVINHKLGQMQQGWFITDINASANIYRSASFNNLTLTLISDNPCTISLWVY